MPLYLHLGIALGGTFNSSGTWFKVNDQSGSPMPYVVYGDQITTLPNLACNNLAGGLSDTRIGAGSTITVPASLVVKFYVDPGCPRYLDVQGTLNLQSTSPAEQVVFTSYRDDAFGGDTNGDASTTRPAPGDWRSVTLYNSSTTFDFARVRYGSYGLQVTNELTGNGSDSGLSNSAGDDVAPLITNARFEENIFGVYLFAKYHGDVTSLITGTIFFSNTYGVGTGIYTGDGVLYSGFSMPTLTNNQFNNHSGFPVYLAGTGFPIYTGSNTFSGNAHPAVALGGFFMNDGTWSLVNGAPDVSGNLPYVVYQTTTVGPYVCVDGMGQPVACPFVDKVIVPANAVFKFYVDGDAPDVPNDPGLRTLMADVYGALDLQSTSSANQVVFTSYRDDIVDDTSGNNFGPAAADWGSVTLRGNQILFDEGGSPQRHFDYALLRYAWLGLQIYSIGAINTNIFPEVDHNTFQDNTYGIYLFTSAAGDINSSIHDNLFADNQYGLGAGASSTGAAFPALANNQFNNISGFPIYLGGTAFPVYNQGNTFSNISLFTGSTGNVTSSIHHNLFSDNTTDLSHLGMFDVIYCYGLLYHLAEPEQALASLAGVCREMILLETCVTPGDEVAPYRVTENPSSRDQAFSGRGCRPTRPWVMEMLRRYYGYAYTTLTQPRHPDFDLNWARPVSKPLHRAVFVGSKAPLAQPSLLDHLPNYQAALPDG